MKERMNVCLVWTMITRLNSSAIFQPVTFGEASLFMLVLDREGVTFLPCFLLFSLPNANHDIPTGQSRDLREYLYPFCSYGFVIFLNSYKPRDYQGKRVNPPHKSSN